MDVSFSIPLLHEKYELFNWMVVDYLKAMNGMLIMLDLIRSSGFPLVAIFLIRALLHACSIVITIVAIASIVGILLYLHR